MRHTFLRFLHTLALRGLVEFALRLLLGRGERRFR